MALFIASDHKGYELKQSLLTSLPSPHPMDMGPFHAETVDYSDYIAPLVHKVLEHPDNRGLLLCGSGVGMSIGANRFKGIRAMVSHTSQEIRTARAHNNINVLCLPANFISIHDALILIDVFLKAPFEGGRHIKRLEKIDSF